MRLCALDLQTRTAGQRTWDWDGHGGGGGCVVVALLQAAAGRWCLQGLRHGCSWEAERGSITLFSSFPAGEEMYFL